MNLSKFTVSIEQVKIVELLKKGGATVLKCINDKKVNVGQL